MIKIFKEFKKIRYCVLRRGDYEIDISIHHEDYPEAEKILWKNGFVKNPPSVSKFHRGWRHYKQGLDIQIGGVYELDICYLNSDIYRHRVKKRGIYYLDETDRLTMYIIHSIVGKRKFKYKKEIKELMKKADLEVVERQLGFVFGTDASKMLLKNLKKRKYKISFSLFVLEFILTYPIEFMQFLYRWYKAKSRLLPLVSIIGPDGSGKSTTANNLERELKAKQYPAKAVYLGRGKKNIIPVNKVASKYVHKAKPWMHFMASPFYFWDLLIRYWFLIHPARADHIIITDRYVTDVMMMKIPLCLRKFYLWFFPKPEYTFYLYNDIDVLHRRRGHNKKDLRKQIKILNTFDVTKKIKTRNQEQTIEEIMRGLF